MSTNEAIYRPCGCCTIPTDIIMLVPDEEFGEVCDACDLAMMEGEKDERHE